MSGLTHILSLLALIFLTSALASGLVKRAPITFPMIFLGLGLLLGPLGLGLLRINLHDPALNTISTLSLAFVFFLDAINLRFDVLQKNWQIPVLSLGPGTLITMGLIALAAVLLLRLSVMDALLIGAILSSVDPVLLRDVVQDERIPRSIREALITEAGSNDSVVLPVLLVLVAIVSGQMGAFASWLAFLAKVFVLGPLAGAAVGAAGVFLVQWARSHTEINREYRALYGIGVLLAAYSVGTWLGSSGFLAVFAAGLVTALLDYDLCDCFVEYGTITSEMLMLLAFLLFGVVLSDLIGRVTLLPVLAFTLVVLAIARPVAINVVLRGTQISRQARLFIGWFGPRGLSTLLFGLLLVTDGVPGAEQILAVAGVVVIISVILHGVTAAPLAARYSQVVARQTLPEERTGSIVGLFAANPVEIPRITPQELSDQLESPHPPLVLDVRSRSSYARDRTRIPSSIRVLPDEVSEWADHQPRDREVVTYCT